MRKIGFRSQRTIAGAAEVKGIGFLTGALVRLRFLPAPPSTGIVFVRTDLRPAIHIAACVENVTGTHRRTTLGNPPHQVGLVEHILAALAGLRIDNCFVELDAPEPPGVDGSAQPFVDVLIDAGAKPQACRRAIYGVDEKIVVQHKGASLALHPHGGPELKVSYFLDYGLTSPIGRQLHTEPVTPETFLNRLADSRTFLLESEAVEMQRQGYGSRTTTADLLVFGRRGPINNRLRYADEPARHKILDLIGDLSLFPHDIYGHLVAYRSGHPLNIELVRRLEHQLVLENGCPAKAVAA